MVANFAFSNLALFLSVSYKLELSPRVAANARSQCSLGCVFIICHNGTCNRKLEFHFHLLGKPICVPGQFV
jgi:hypothetical protein